MDEESSAKTSGQVAKCIITKMSFHSVTLTTVSTRNGLIKQRDMMRTPQLHTYLLLVPS